MSLYFYGSSFAARHMKDAAIARGCDVREHPEEAEVLFVSEDTPTANDGTRNLERIYGYIDLAVKQRRGCIVVTSQVPPGFCRRLGIAGLLHQAETLRVKDAKVRAYFPEQIIVGSGLVRIQNAAYLAYLKAFECPVFHVDWETAEFAKIAINMTLAAQVDSASRLSAAAAKVGADWNKVRAILAMDGRIGPKSYLEPGRWQESPHLLRDFVTLQQIENGTLGQVP